MVEKDLFTSESVTEGHPDKVADVISDSIVDAALAQDPKARVAAETLVTTNLVVLAGETTINGQPLPYEDIARNAIRQIGYVIPDIHFHADTAKVILALHEQSRDIAMGVDTGGAGDQGLMFGYATKRTEKTPTMMPAPIHYAQQLSRRLSQVRRDGTIDWMRPDGKTQVTFENETNDQGQKIPVRIDQIVVSAHHNESVSQEQIHADIRRHVIDAICGDLIDKDTVIHINPTGRFVTGGPHGDTGLTGRKIIVDTYGGWGRHGGGAFSSKDPTKVDRSAAYAARYVAKNIVAAELADEAEVQIAYAIGVAQPVSIAVNTNRTNGKFSEADIVAAVRKVFDLRPQSIIDSLELRKPQYVPLAMGGHMGREDLNVRWEQTDRTEDLLRAIRG